MVPLERETSDSRRAAADIKGNGYRGARGKGCSARTAGVCLSAGCSVAPRELAGRTPFPECDRRFPPWSRHPPAAERTSAGENGIVILSLSTGGGLQFIYILLIFAPMIKKDTQHRAVYPVPLCRITEWMPERSILSNEDYSPFEDEDYSDGGEYIW